MNLPATFYAGALIALVIGILVGRLITEFWHAKQISRLTDIRELLRYQIHLSGGNVKPTQDEIDLINRLEDHTLFLNDTIASFTADLHFIHPQLQEAIDTYRTKRAEAEAKAKK